MDTGRDRYVIEPVRQAGEVLKYIAAAREPVTTVQVAQACGLAPDKAFRLCVTLGEIGFLNQIGSRYELGMGLGLLWARKKATLEDRRNRIDKALELMTVEGEN
jgi:DNA-binding IclR family transcriptional regulator